MTMVLDPTKKNRTTAQLRDRERDKKAAPAQQVEDPADPPRPPGRLARRAHGQEEPAVREGSDYQLATAPSARHRGSSDAPSPEQRPRAPATQRGPRAQQGSPRPSPHE